MTATTTANVEADLARVIGGIDNLPTPPIVLQQIQKVLNDPAASAYDIGSILQEDPAMSAKVLKLTNSAYYGLVRTIESVKQAVVIVGIDTIRNLVLSASVFEAFADKQVDREMQEHFWRHSLAVAFGARLVAHSLISRQTFDAEAGFSGGLLHDIGKMVVAVYLAEQADQIRQLKTENPNRPDHELEDQVLGYNHTQIGALLGERWKLPANLIETIRYHHAPRLTPNTDNGLPYLVHTANHLATLTFDYDPDAGTYLEPLHEGTLEYIGGSEHDLPVLGQRLREEYARAETFMEMARGH